MSGTVYVSGVSNRRNLLKFSFPAKTDVCGMTENISFPSNGNFFGKLRFCVFIIIDQQNSGNANRLDLKKILWSMRYQDWVKISCHLESKSSVAFNFLLTFALKAITSL